MSSEITKIICYCGIVWKVPVSKGKGSAAYNFQCDGRKGCKRYISIYAQDNEVVDVSGAKEWWT